MAPTVPRCNLVVVQPVPHRHFSIISPGRSILSLLAVDSASGRVCEEHDDVTTCETAPWVVAEEYVRVAGTSMAAAHGSGVAALVLSHHPEFTMEQVRQVLLQTADDLGPSGWDADFGYGRVNAAAAVAIDTIPVAQILTPENREKVWEWSFPLCVEGSALSPSVPLAKWELSIRPADQRDGKTLVADGTTELSSGILGVVDIAEPLLLEPGQRIIFNARNDFDPDNTTEGLIQVFPYDTVCD